MSHKSDKYKSLNLKEDQVLWSFDSSRLKRFLEILAEIWMAVALSIYFLMRILGSETFRNVYLRWKAF